MKTFQCRVWTILAAGALLAVVGGAQPALALGTATAAIDHVVPQQIPITSNGTIYTQVPWGQNIGVDIHVEIDSGFSGHVKSWSTYFLLDSQEDRIAFPEFGVGKSYKPFRRPHSVDRVEHLQVPWGAFGPFLIAQCNKLAASLRQSGLSNHQIFAQDRTIDLAVIGLVDVDFSGIVNLAPQQALDWDTEKKLRLVCKKWDGSDVPTADSLMPGFQVTGAKLSISPAYRNLTTKCPITVPLVAEFTATNTGRLQFRFVSASGKVSKPISATISGKTGGVYKTLYEQHIQVPLPLPGSGQGGAGAQAVGGGFWTGSGPEEPIGHGTPPKSPGSGGMTQVEGLPMPGNVHGESFRVEVLAPATGVVSEFNGYNIICALEPEQPVTGPQQSVTVPPPNPHPDPSDPTSPVAKGNMEGFAGTVAPTGSRTPRELAPRKQRRGQQ